MPLPPCQPKLPWPSIAKVRGRFNRRKSLKRARPAASSLGTAFASRMGCAAAGLIAMAMS